LFLLLALNDVARIGDLLPGSTVTNIYTMYQVVYQSMRPFWAWIFFQQREPDSRTERGGNWMMGSVASDEFIKLSRTDMIMRRKLVAYYCWFNNRMEDPRRTLLILSVFLSLLQSSLLLLLLCAESLVPTLLSPRTSTDIGRRW
jgi:hypothetical protein